MNQENSCLEGERRLRSVVKNSVPIVQPKGRHSHPGSGPFLFGGNGNRSARPSLRPRRISNSRAAVLVRKRPFCWAKSDRTAPN